MTARWAEMMFLFIVYIKSKCLGIRKNLLYMKQKRGGRAKIKPSTSKKITFMKNKHRSVASVSLSAMIRIFS